MILRRGLFGLLAWLLLGVVAAGQPTSAPADPALPDGLMARMGSADIVLLGEVHDIPAHHARQAEIVAQLRPAAVVWEMLTALAADRVTARLRDDADALAAALDWSRSGWPDFAMYHPIFAAAGSARVYGAAVPRSAARIAMETGPAVSFGADAARFGLTVPLPPAEQAAREAMQARAHCDALPEEMLPGMVAIQRLRDAELARAALRALDETGGPVVVITGNGHARADWGVPAYLRAARPGARVFALGQSEDGRIDGRFDAVLDAPAAARPDPCAAFD